MGRKPRADRSPEEKWQIVQEGIKSGNVSETCRRHGIALNLFHRWKDDAEQRAKAALGGRIRLVVDTSRLIVLLAKYMYIVLPQPSMKKAKLQNELKYLFSLQCNGQFAPSRQR